MLNFTGSTKKRIVNLGERQGGVGRNSFLEQNRKQRLEREELRRRDKSALVIQRHVVKYLDLLREAQALTPVWLASPKGPDDLHWCAQALFIIRFGPRSNLTSIVTQVSTKILEQQISVPPQNLAFIFKIFKAVASRGRQVTSGLICLHHLLSVQSLPLQYPQAMKSMINCLCSYMTEESAAMVVDLVFRINIADSKEEFLKFLIRTPRKYFSKSIGHCIVIAEALEQPGALQYLKTLSDSDRVALLTVLVSMNESGFTVDEYRAHARILSSIDFSVVSQASEDEPSRTSLSRRIDVSESDYGILSVLTSSTYVASSFHNLRTVDPDLCVSFISQLMFIFTSAKTSISMSLSIIPGLSTWLYDHLASSDLFKLYVSAATSIDSLPRSQAQLPDDKGFDQFWELVFTFEQILSSWLMISTDYESFQNDKFPIENIKTFSQFLKTLCLTLIFEKPFTEDWRTRSFKDVSISLLNQLYLKNLRLKFLPNNLWRLRVIRFDSSSMITSILDDDLQHTDLSSEEETEEVTRGVTSRNANRSRDIISKLEVLNKVPFFVDFTDRVKVFQSLIIAEKERIGADSRLSFFSDELNSQKLSADIRRDYVLEDAFESFHSSGQNFKHKLSVTFFNEHGAEAGIDGGGLTKEFLTLVVREGFNPANDLALFKETSSYTLYPNDDIFLQSARHIDLELQRKRLMYLSFLGMVIGKCLYESILIDVNFAAFFLSKWRVAQNPLKNSIDDLVFLDSELYANLNKLLDMSPKQLQQLDLNFVLDENVNGEVLQFDLLSPNGASTPVTVSNRLVYVHKMSNFKLNQSLQPQTKYFLDGLFKIIKPNWLNMFDPFELQKLIGGGDDIDIEDWRANVNYGGYFDDDITIQLFWEVVSEMTSQERCDLVKFVTSVARAPLLGFGSMYPKFGINNGGAPDRLPTASTCTNLLKLPDYRDKGLIRQKLLYSIYANSGFDLS